MKRHLAYRLLIWVAAVAATLGFPLPLTASHPDPGPEILGLRMGMTAEAAKAGMYQERHCSNGNRR